MRPREDDLPARRWVTGDKARVTFDGRTVDAVVILASANGVSLMLAFDAMLGGYVATMPVLYEGGAFVDLLGHRPVVLEDR